MDKKHHFWGGVEAPFNKSEEQAWDELQARIARGETSVIKMFNPWKYVAAAAAVVVFTLSIFFFGQNDTIVAQTNAGEIKTIVLPDGSQLVLNALSTASYEGEWNEERIINLDGAGFFKVKKGSRFKVFTKYGEVEVLGTSFDVTARENQFRVICETGRVKVSTASESVIINPGEQADFDKKNLVHGKAKRSGKAWISGQFIYENESLTNVIKDIEIQFNIEINGGNFDGKIYSGQFEKSKIEEVLNLVLSPYGMSYKKLDARNYTIIEANN
jgi:ferric-dicitrate binding protein FerR (iron transport regulator)